jgi:hypothetical protein
MINAASPAEARKKILVKPASNNAVLSEEAAMKLPFYWMRLINILAKGLDICKLEGKDRIAFVKDINKVQLSPIDKRTSLEKIRFSRIVTRAKQHDTFLTGQNMVKIQATFLEIEKYVNRLIKRDDYYAAVQQLLASVTDDQLSEKRSLEVLSYLSYVAQDENLEEADKSIMRNIIMKKAMPVMTAYHAELQRILDLLNREEFLTKRINLQDRFGAGHRRTQEVDISINAKDVSPQEAARLKQAEKMRKVIQARQKKMEEGS